MRLRLRQVMPMLVAVTALTATICGAAGLAEAAAPAAPSEQRAGLITTIAGGPGGPASGRSVAVSHPCGLAADNGVLYFTESGSGVIRRLNERSGLLTTVAGNRTNGVSSLAGPEPLLAQPCTTTVDRAGNLIFADTGNNVVRVIAARTGVFYGRQMRAGHMYAIGGNSFTGPEAVTVDGQGNLLISSQTSFNDVDQTTAGTAVVSVLAGARGSFYGRRMVPGHVYPLAGQGCPGAGSTGCAPGLSGDSGPALAATFGTDIWGLVRDAHGNVLIADTDDNVIRVIAQRPGRFYGVTMKAGDIYSVVGGGSGSGLGDGGPALAATLDGPRGLAIDRAGNLVLSDSGDGRIRAVPVAGGRFYGQQMAAMHIYTIAGGGPDRAGTPSPARRAFLYQPAGLAFDAGGNLVLADQGRNRVQLVAVRTGRFYGRRMLAGQMYTIAGTGYYSYSGDGGLATRAELWPLFAATTNSPGGSTNPGGLAVTGNGNIVVADSNNNRIRVLAAHSGVFYGIRMVARHIYTVAGTGASGFTGDGGRATRAELSLPGGVAVDNAGNILLSDEGNMRIRVVANKSGRFYGRHMLAGHIYFLAGGGTAGAGGVPASHEEIFPLGLAVDRHGNVVLADSFTEVIAEHTGRFYGQVMKAGYLYRLRPVPVNNVDAASAVAVDHTGNILIASAFSAIQVIAVKAGTFYGVRMQPEHIYTIAGGGRNRGLGDGGRAARATVNQPSGIAVDRAGNVLIADSLNERIRVIAVRSGVFYGVRMRAGDIYTIAGQGPRSSFGYDGGFSGDGVAGTRALLSNPGGIAADGKNVVILDDGNNRVREITG